MINGNETVSRPALSYEQLAVASNPRLGEELADAAHAYVIVHPGYLMSEAAKVRELYGGTYSSDELDAFFEPIFCGEGNYDDYLGCLRSLFTYLRETDDPAPVIVYTEQQDTISDAYPYPELIPPSRAFTVVTEQADATPVREVAYQQQRILVTESQRVGVLYDWLGRSGVTNVYVAGELGLRRGGTIFPSCAGRVAMAYMDQGFTVQGIEGAVFPTLPVELHNPDAEGQESYGPVAEAMHINTVPLPKK